MPATLNLKIQKRSEETALLLVHGYKGMALSGRIIEFIFR